MTVQQARINQQLAFGQSSARKGTCTAIDWVAGLATVNVPGSDLLLPMVGVPPILNDLCWIGSMGNTTVVLGPVPRPPYATVTGTPAGGLVTVLCDDTVPRDVTYQGADPTLGTRVLIDWTGGGAIVLAPLADPTSGAPITTGGVIHTFGTHSRTFNPYTSATWRDGVYASGWAGGLLWDSDHNRGGWFYKGIADTIPDSATNGTLKIFVPSGNGYGGNPSIGAHALAGPSGSLASITGRKVIPASGGWVDISEFFDSFKTGALKGIGTGGGGNWKFPAAGQNNSGAIAATWRS